MKTAKRQTSLKMRRKKSEKMKTRVMSDVFVVEWSGLNHWPGAITEGKLK
jgi:hypothetical protein